MQKCEICNFSLAVIKKPEKYSLDNLLDLHSLSGFLFIIFKMQVEPALVADIHWNQ